MLLLNLMNSCACLAAVTFITCAVPCYAVELSHIACGFVTFFEGFLYMVPTMPGYFRWAIYINPYFWTYSAEMKTSLADHQLPCPHTSPLLCLERDGNAVLAVFGFTDSDPNASLLVLLLMVIFYWLNLCVQLLPLFILLYILTFL